MLPKKINVLNRCYEIRIVDKREEISPMGDLSGLFNPDTSMIDIYNCRSLQQQEQILLHELMHAIAYATGDSELYKDESRLERLAVAWHAVLLHNDFSFIKDDK